jgi:hypothetical protein
LYSSYNRAVRHGWYEQAAVLNDDFNNINYE